MREVLDVLHREFVYLWYYFDVQLRQIFGYWVLGILLGSCVSVFLKDKIHGVLRSMSESRMGLWGIVPAGLLGIASPLCMYGTIPLAASLSRSGMRDEWLASFMMCSILLNPQLIIYSTALGTTALVVRIVSCFLCGIAAGLLIWAFRSGKPFFRFDGFDEPVSRDTDPNPALRLLKNIGRNIKATGPYFLLGVLLSALFQRYVPQDLMTAAFGGNEAFGVLMAATIGVPLYACGGGTIPLPGLAHGRHEHGQRSGLYGHRAVHQDHQSGGAEDRAGSEAFSPLSGLCDGFFLPHGAGGQSFDLRME